MLELPTPLWADVLLLLVAAAAIGVAGTKLARYADQLADRTGLGEAITGAAFLGLITALPGLVASVVAALKGQPALAIGNALGGIAIQTAALAVADFAHRRANLEHAAASAMNLLQTALLLLLLTLVALTFSAPDATVAHVHPMTPVLFVAAGAALWLVWQAGERRMWRPRETDETVVDEPEPEKRTPSLGKLLTGMAIAGLVTIASGVLVAETSENLVEKTPLSPAVVGGLFMAIATSLPELVTSVAAVRRGALVLAVGDIVGGNFFDVLFVAAADLAFLGGSLYHAEGIGAREHFLASLAILLNLVLLIGLVYRQKRGPANIGFESVALLALYGGGFAVLALAM